MNKEYPLIYLNGESYMVEDETSEGRRRLAITFHKETGKPALDEYYPDDLAYYVHKPKKLLATTDKSLGLPLLPPIEEDIDRNKMLQDLGGYSRAEMANSYGLNPAYGYIIGYKANKKKWTDEDMHKMFAAGWSAHKENKGYIVEEAFKALKPQPIAVEVEMEKYCKPDCDCHKGKLGCVYGEWRPKVDQNNFVIVKRWIFNEK